jgi:glycosyltransferase involved in cell wall biosynthesis
MKQNRFCVIIPTYNNEPFLAETLDSASAYAATLIVVDDGSDDGTETVLQSYRTRIVTVSYRPNRGKGYALSRGFDKAEELGFTHAITMDSDGQHLAEDLPRFVHLSERRPEALIIGSRPLKQENMPKSNTFANRFSNFWFFVQTGIRLPDTQTGFRLYPLAEMKGIRPFTSRYEAELELLVRLAWRRTQIISVPVRVRYPEKGVRITHFRPLTDFLRISLLNTRFCFLALVYGYPSKLFHTLANRQR